MAGLQTPICDTFGVKLVCSQRPRAQPGFWIGGEGAQTTNQIGEDQKKSSQSDLRGLIFSWGPILDWGGEIVPKS